MALINVVCKTIDESLFSLLPMDCKINFFGSLETSFYFYWSPCNFFFYVLNDRDFCSVLQSEVCLDLLIA